MLASLAPICGEGERLIALGEKQGRKLGEEQGRQQALREAVARMAARGLPMDEIADLLGVELEQARALAQDASVAKPVASKRETSSRTRRG